MQGGGSKLNRFEGPGGQEVKEKFGGPAREPKRRGWDARQDRAGGVRGRMQVGTVINVRDVEMSRDEADGRVRHQVVSGEGEESGKFGYLRQELQRRNGSRKRRG